MLITRLAFPGWAAMVAALVVMPKGEEPVYLQVTEAAEVPEVTGLAPVLLLSVVAVTPSTRLRATP